MAWKNNYSLRVKDVMSINPVYTFPETSVRDAARLMAKKDVNSIIIVDNEKRILGIITDEDIVRKVVVNNLDSELIKCKDIMTVNPFTIDPEKTIEEAIKIMKDLNIRQLPVTKNGILVGMITAKDIIRIQPELLQIFKREDVEFLKFEEENFCEMCGKLSKELIVYKSMLICPSCYKSIMYSRR
ncbi:MAG: CBS domain-containing protein [Candidatus Woesearchaeota archaeon]